MAIDVIMPALGMSQETGRIVQWLKQDGDVVAMGEPLLEIETDKSVVEIEASGEGTLVILKPASDEDVPVAEVIGRLVTEERAAVTSTVSAAPKEVPSTPIEEATRPNRVKTEESASASSRVAMSPKARRMAKERGVDVQNLRTEGQPVHVADLDLGVEAKPLEGGDDTWVRYTGIQDATASRVVDSWHQAPHFYLMRDIDATGLSDWLSAIRRNHDKATMTDLLVRACAAALVEFPRQNASPGNGGILVHPHVNIGLAVAMDQGLVVPVLKNTETMAVEDIAAARQTLVERARRGRLSPDDLAGGTFTISNLGMFGIDRFLPVLNLQQALLLAVGTIKERPMVKDGLVIARQTLSLTLACDHRVTDGAASAKFLDRLASILEQPYILIR